MNVNLPLFLLAVALLWFPRRWLRLGLPVLRRRKRKGAGSAAIVEPWKSREPGDPRVSFAAEFTKFRNYIDLLRAAAGSLVLAGGLGIPASLVAEEGAPRAVALQVMGIRALVLLVGVLLQTLRREHGHFAYAPPIFFLAGISLGLCDLRAAGFAFGMVWALGAALPSAQGFLSIYAVLIVAFGSLFARGFNLWTLYAGGLAFLPVLLSLLAKRPLTIMTRRATRLPRM